MTLQERQRHGSVSSATQRTMAADEEIAFLALFFSLGKTLQMVGESNETFSRQLEKFWSLSRKIADGSGAVSIKTIDDRFFINDRHCKVSHKFRPSKATLHQWAALGLAGIEFQVTEGPDTLTSLLTLINSPDTVNESVERLRDKMAEKQLERIRVFGRDELVHLQEMTEEERLRLRQKARAVFFHSLRTVDSMASCVSQGKEVSVTRTKRVIQSLVDQLLKQDSALMEMTAIKDFDDYTFAHSVNVCIYSLSIGVNLGLDHKRLSQLGFAALFHDLGKTRIPSEVVKKTGLFDDSDWAYMRRHPSLGARSLLRNFSPGTHTIRGALVAYEHHMNLDGTGYPRREQVRELNLFSRIVSVADTFDAITSGRVYIPERLSPPEALRRMTFQMGKKYDQLILKIFIGSVGLYPPGTLVLLNDKTLAIVERVLRGNIDRPLVRVIGDQTALWDDIKLKNLASSENANLSIVRSVDPITVGVDMKRYILSDESFQRSE